MESVGMGHHSFIGSLGDRATSTTQNTHTLEEIVQFFCNQKWEWATPSSLAERLECTTLFSHWWACRMPCGTSPQPFMKWRCRANASCVSRGFSEPPGVSENGYLWSSFCVFFSPQQVLSMIINAAYKPGRVLRELQLVEDPHWNFQEETLKAK